MKPRPYRLAALFMVSLLFGGCAVFRPEPVWICGNGLFLDFPDSAEPAKPCTGTKDLSLLGAALPPDGD